MFPSRLEEGGRVNIRDVAVRAYRVGRAFGLTAEDLGLALGWLSEVWNLGRTYNENNTGTSMEVSVTNSLASLGPYSMGASVVGMSMQESQELPGTTPHDPKHAESSKEGEQTQSLLDEDAEPGFLERGKLRIEEFMEEEPGHADERKQGISLMERSPRGRGQAQASSLASSSTSSMSLGFKKRASPPALGAERCELQ